MVSKTVSTLLLQHILILKCTRRGKRDRTRAIRMNKWEIDWEREYIRPMDSLFYFLFFSSSSTYVQTERERERLGFINNNEENKQKNWNKENRKCQQWNTIATSFYLCFCAFSSSHFTTQSHYLLLKLHKLQNNGKSGTKLSVGVNLK